MRSRKLYEKEIEITASTNLEKEDVERMVREAKQNKAKDRQHKELAQARNDTDTTIYQVEKSLRELNGKIPSRDRSTIERTIEDLKIAKESNDTARIKNQSERLQQASYAIAQQM